MSATLPRPDPGFAEAEEIQRFWDDNFDELLKQYPERFVAVDLESHEVVASNPDLVMLFYELRDQGLDARADVAIQFVSSWSGSLLL